ncbi:MAG: thioredoxin domain-containing protein [Chroococcidiopsidaceae cyanobacterium CP_BM_RX_35]|nr:thioredoxin domain-containing protein [Chroococcidiopsidaceae cyanobacterium CP_BM_RX_35]
MSQFSPSNQLTQPVSARDHIQGSLQAPVILIQYGDFQCPHCYEANRIVKQIQRQLDDQLCFGFRHFPLTRLHAQAQRAAEATGVAADQGKFWLLHDMLFEHQHTLDDGSLVEYALNLGFKMPRFLWNFSERVYTNCVQADFHSGIESGVTGTPTFFINGVRLADSWKLEGLLAAIKQARYSASP